MQSQRDAFASFRGNIGYALCASVAALGIVFAISSQASFAQQFPTKPIRFVVASAPGSGNDVATRIVMAKVSDAWGQPVVIENRAGANQRIAPELVARAPPDGYTLLQCGTVISAINPAVYRELRYHPVRDFAPITLFARAPNVLLLQPLAPVTSVRAFVAYVAANPGKFNYGSSGVGSTLHLSMEMLGVATGIKMTHIPYKGGALALADLLGGQLLAVFQNVPVALPVVKSGKVRALGVTAPKRSVHLPDIPTFAESGFSLDVYAWYGACAPAAVAKAVLARLNEAMVGALQSPEIHERFGALGIEPAPMSIQEFDAFIRAETIKWAKAVKDAGVPPQ